MAAFTNIGVSFDRFSSNAQTSSCVYDQTPTCNKVEQWPGTDTTSRLQSLIAGAWRDVQRKIAG